MTQAAATRGGSAKREAMEEEARRGSSDSGGVRKGFEPTSEFANKPSAK